MSLSSPVSIGPVAVIGGTGAEGSGLAMRWVAAGLEVIIGSRSAEKAQRRAAELLEALGARARGRLRGLPNAEAAAAAGEVVVVTVPYKAHRPILEAIREAVQGKIVVDCTVPLHPPQVTRVHVPAGGSAAQEAQALLGPGARVVAAFQNVAAHKLQALDDDVGCDVLVCGDDPAAREHVIALAEAAGMRAWHAGPLQNAVAVEGLTPILIGINKRYHTKGAGIRITNVAPEE
ncbi:MAG: NADPH-dependent F420 reductase [Ardenticatenia bacterium]|nr:NADPH-dependent F420 reductase [Ardenticatenia bacterium]